MQNICLENLCRLKTLALFLLRTAEARGVPNQTAGHAAWQEHDSSSSDNSHQSGTQKLDMRGLLVFNISFALSLRTRAKSRELEGIGVLVAFFEPCPIVFFVFRYL